MTAIVVINDEGEVIYQNTVGNFLELAKTIRDGGELSKGNELNSAVWLNGLRIQANQSFTPKRDAPKLTARQCRVLQCLASSLSPEQTAIKLGVSENTVRDHIKKLKKKFKTDSRDQLMAMAGYFGLCDPFQNEK